MKSKYCTNKEKTCRYLDGGLIGEPCDHCKSEEELTLKEKLEGLRSLLGKYWKDKDPDEYIKELRGNCE